MMFSEKTIKRKLMILAFVICLLPVTILYFLNEKRLLDLVLEEVEIANSQMTSLVNKELTKMKQTTVLLANNPAWEKYYTEPERQEYWEKEQIKAFQYIKEHFAETSEIYFLDAAYKGAEAKKLDNQIENKQPFYEAAIKLKKGEVYQSEPYISANSQRWVLGNGTPLVLQEKGLYGEKKVGVIHYEVNLSFLSESLKKNKIGTASTFVMNEKGYLIASSNPAHNRLIQKTAFQKKVSLPFGKTVIKKPILWEQFVKQSKGKQIVKTNGKKYFVSFQKIPIRNGVSWVVGTVKPAPAFSVFSASNLFIYVMLIVIILVVLGAAFVVNKILKEIQLSQNRLSTLAHYDNLTGLPNRFLFMEQINDIIKASNNKKNRFSAVLFVDLDRFKFINDTMGHAAGDLLLTQVAKRLIDCVGKKGTVARFGGDEFVVLLKDAQNKQAVIQTAEKINESISLPFLLNENKCFINTSVGISLYPDDGVSTEVLIKHADLAMYQAKESGGGGYVFFQKEFNDQTIRRLKLENNIRKAIEKNEFEVHYQPKVELPSEKLVGIEALIRWHQPEIGMISPMEFIPIAEETGLINMIGNWVLRTACRQNKTWQEEGYSPVVISVNVSAHQFQQGDFDQMVKSILKETGLDGKWLELELTESVFMNHEEVVINTLESLKKLGVKISIDDFGTGYSSFNYLKRFPIDTLKIDRSFIKDIFDKNEDRSITKAIITMGHSLNCIVVAEGVETENQHTLLQSYNCDQIQGYYHSPPITAEKMIEYIEMKNGRGLNYAEKGKKEIKTTSFTIPVLVHDSPAD